jgi:hypothetical protein
MTLLPTGVSEDNGMALHERSSANSDRFLRTAMICPKRHCPERHCPERHCPEGHCPGQGTAECYSETVNRQSKKADDTYTERCSLEELAVSQGVQPVTEFETLLGHPSSDDESADEFSAMLRAWRDEGSAPASAR